MPLMQCKSGGKDGWKFGPSGHCYTGPDGRKMAIKQMIAEKENGVKGSFGERAINVMELAEAKAELEELESAVEEKK